MCFYWLDVQENVATLQHAHEIDDNFVVWFHDFVRAGRLCVVDINYLAHGNYYKNAPVVDIAWHVAIHI